MLSLTFHVVWQLLCSTRRFIHCACVDAASTAFVRTGAAGRMLQHNYEMRINALRTHDCGVSCFVFVTNKQAATERTKRALSLKLAYLRLVSYPLPIIICMLYSALLSPTDKRRRHTASSQRHVHRGAVRHGRHVRGAPAPRPLRRGQRDVRVRAQLPGRHRSDQRMRQM